MSVSGSERKRRKKRRVADCTGLSFESRVLKALLQVRYSCRLQVATACGLLWTSARQCKAVLHHPEHIVHNSGRGICTLITVPVDTRTKSKMCFVRNH